MRLYLCEKPSQGHDIARVLGAHRREAGCFTGPDNVAVTWCIGHLVAAASPEAYGEQYRQWTIEHLPIVPNPWRLEIKESTAAQFRIVRRLLGIAAELVIATDADREGEMIAREILDICNYHGPVKRLWLSALDDASIRKALVSLRNGSDTLPLYHGALARSRADWIWGMNLTRLFTVLARRAGYDGVLSVGRVQTPTLQLVVQRDREIAQFVATPFWNIDVTLKTGSAAFLAQWIPPSDTTDESGRCLKESAALAAAERLRKATSARVSSVEIQHIRESPPLPFDLSTLQEVCSRNFGQDVSETLEIAQALYEKHKAITYPRSDSGYLPESMFAEAPTVLDALLASDPTLAPIMKQLDRTQRSRAWNDSKVSAHHGIIPSLGTASLRAMSSHEKAVYELVRARYLAQFLPEHQYDRTVAQFLCTDLVLRATGKHVTSVGWRVVEGVPGTDEPHNDAPDQHLPNLVNDQTCAVSTVELRTLKTRPPRPYSQGELVRAMKTVARQVKDPRLKQILTEKTGIGTEATRASIIQGLITRGYLIQQGKTVRATQSAFTLIDAIPPQIADPGTTAVWEQALDQIACGRMAVDEFVCRQTVWITDLIRQYATLSLTIPDSQVPACSQCHAPMRRRAGKYGEFWSCSRYPDCKNSQPILPAGSRTTTTRAKSRRRQSRKPT